MTQLGDPGGSKQFGTFDYEDKSGGVSQINIQYKVGGGSWTNADDNPITVNNQTRMASWSPPNLTNVTCTQLNADGGSWATGSPISTGVTSASGVTASNGRTTVTDS